LDTFAGAYLLCQREHRNQEYAKSVHHPPYG